MSAFAERCPTPTTAGCRGWTPASGWVPAPRWSRSAAWAAANPLPTPISTCVLLHTGKAEQVKDVAEALWYPIWDSEVGLDHSVRTPDQALRVAQDDLKALLGLLDVRHVAGDAGVSGPLRERRARSVAGHRAQAGSRAARDLSRRAGGSPAMRRSCSSPT